MTVLQPAVLTPLDQFQFRIPRITTAIDTIKRDYQDAQSHYRSLERKVEQAHDDWDRLNDEMTDLRLWMADAEHALDTLAAQGFSSNFGTMVDKPT